MRPTDLQSKVIAFLRFPLIVLVLTIHCDITTLGGDWASVPYGSKIIEVISQRVATIAIPFFFFISGYMFFKTGKFTTDIYLGSWHGAYSRSSYPISCGTCCCSSWPSSWDFSPTACPS